MKHCTQVPKSGISFLACSTSELRRRTVLPSISADRLRMWPLAGGSSTRSTNWPLRIVLRRLLLMLGSPAAIKTEPEADAMAVGVVVVVVVVAPRPRPANTLGGGMLRAVPVCECMPWFRVNFV